MVLTKMKFFGRAVKILYQERNQGDFTYRQAIEKAVQEFGITYEQLRKLSDPDISEINI